MVFSFTREMQRETQQNHIVEEVVQPSSDNDTIHQTTTNETDTITNEIDTITNETDTITNETEIITNETEIITNN
jgi:hypothetical protein